MMPTMRSFLRISFRLPLARSSRHRSGENGRSRIAIAAAFGSPSAKRRNSTATPGRSVRFRSSPPATSTACRFHFSSPSRSTGKSSRRLSGVQR
jgi:hypothetical protein